MQVLIDWFIDFIADTAAEMPIYRSPKEKKVARNIRKIKKTKKTRIRNQ